MAIEKYFWNLNEKALKETKRILRDPHHPAFPVRMVDVLSRCDNPKELSEILSKKEFVDAWPKIRTYWMKRERQSIQRDWWEMIVGQLIPSRREKIRPPRGGVSADLHRLGVQIREMRIQKGLSQAELASRTGMKQPDVSNIEAGKKNATLLSLLSVCKVLGIKRIDL